MEETVCDMDVLAAANGEQLVHGDLLVPPASRTRSSRATKSASVMPSDDSGHLGFGTPAIIRRTGHLP